MDSVVEMGKAPAPSGSKLTEISVTTEVATRSVNQECSSPGKHASLVLPKALEPSYDPYSVSIEAGG